MADTSLIAVGATACGLATVFAWIALKVQREHRRFCARGMRADGVVSRLGQRRGQSLSEDAMGNSTGTRYITVPVVRFRAANGSDYEIDAPEAPMTVGAPVQVAYEPAQPSGGRAVDRTPKIGCAVVLLVLGVVLVVLGSVRGWLLP